MMAGRREPAPEVLSFTGPDNIFVKWIVDGLIEGGKGNLHGWEQLPQDNRDVFEVIYVNNNNLEAVTDGFYLTRDKGIQLFLNMGAGAIIYQGLPSANGEVYICYHGDSLGMRTLEMTSDAIKEEMLVDLNEAFKMLSKNMDEGFAASITWP